MTDLRPDPVRWAAVVDTLVATRIELGMALARARVEVREYPAGTVLVCRVRDDLAPLLRDGREDYSPVVIAACAAVGIAVDDVAYVEAETGR
jgi:hypothetical protein